MIAATGPGTLFGLTTTRGTCSLATRTCVLGDLAPGQQALIRTDLRAGLRGTLRAALTATHATAERVTANDRATITTTVKPDTTIPRLRLAATTLHVRAQHTATFRLTCPATERTCTGSVRPTFRGKRLHTANVRLVGGRAVTLRVVAQLLTATGDPARLAADGGVRRERRRREREPLSRHHPRHDPEVTTVSRSPRGARSAPRARRRTPRRRSRRRASERRIAPLLGSSERSMWRSGFQRSERISAFEHCVYASSISTRMPSRGALPSTVLGASSCGVVGERGAAVDAERVADARDHEQEADVRVHEDVPQRVGDPVAGPLGDQQRALVEDPDEAGRVAARADVAAAGRGRRWRCRRTARAR